MDYEIPILKGRHIVVGVTGGIAAYKAADLTSRLSGGIAGRSRVSAFGMGETGFPTRVLSAVRGAGLVYAAIEAGAASAPGQPTVGDLLDTFRLRSLGPASRVFGVAGSSDSRSA